MKWFEFVSKGVSELEILIYDEIGAWGVSAKDFATELNRFKDVKNITLRLNTPGGSVMDGNAIYNALKRHKAQVAVEIDGMALSMGSVIAMAGDTITMAENAMFMIHNPWGMAVGDSDELRKTADVMDKMKNTIITPYVNKTGMDAKDVSELMDNETWFDASEALDKGFIDSITDYVEISAHFDLSKFQNVPKFLVEPLDLKPTIFTLPNTPENEQVINKLVGPNSVPITTVSIHEDTNMPTDNPTVEAVDKDKLIQDAQTKALALEKTRSDDIRNIFTIYGDTYRILMDRCLIDQNISTDDTRKLLLDEIGKGQEPVGGSIEILRDQKDRTREGMALALAMRSGQVERDQTNDYQNMSLMEMARENLRVNNVSLRGMSKMQICAAAFTHSTSDFPWLLENVIGKELQTAYGNFPETWMSIATTSSVPDFKVNSRIRLGSFNSLDTIPEGDEYTSGSFSEEREPITASTKGKMISFTRQAMINDDLGGFMRIAQMMGRAAARTVGNDVYNLITSNPVMSDGVAFFDAAHNNLAASGAAPTVITVGEARSAMRLQQDPDGNDSLDIRPKILAVPVALEDTANVLVASETDPGQSNSRRPNPIRGFAEVTSDPRLDTNSVLAWYLFADPNLVPSYEVAFLDGNQNPFLESENGFTIDGVRWKVRLDYGVAPIDWRGGYKNPGS